MYRALYRKWRPQRFEDVVAQHGTVTALRNQVAAGRVGHAYLFTGVRGTGKTTCAKIFAKAVNCLNPHDGDPCCQCSICRGIDDGSILDVVAMAAADGALAAGVAVVGVEAVDRLGKDLGAGGLARAAHACKQVGVANAPGGHLVAQRGHRAVLGHHILKPLGSPLAVQRAIHPALLL